MYFSEHPPQGAVRRPAAGAQGCPSQRAPALAGLAGEVQACFYCRSASYVYTEDPAFDLEYGYINIAISTSSGVDSHIIIITTPRVPGVYINLGS